MADMDLVDIKKQSKPPADGSNIYTEAKSSEVEESLTMESLKAACMRMKDKLQKMDAIINDLKSRLHQSSGEIDELMGI